MNVYRIIGSKFVGVIKWHEKGPPRAFRRFLLLLLLLLVLPSSRIWLECIDWMVICGLYVCILNEISKKELRQISNASMLFLLSLSCFFFGSHSITQINRIKFELIEKSIRFNSPRIMALHNIVMNTAAEKFGVRLMVNCQQRFRVKWPNKRNFKRKNWLNRIKNTQAFTSFHFVSFQLANVTSYAIHTHAHDSIFNI